VGGFHTQGVIDRTDHWNNFCSNQYLNFFFLFISYSHLRYKHNIIQKIVFIFITKNKNKNLNKNK